MVLAMTQQQYRAEVAQQKMTPAERLTQLTARNEHLDAHRWTDEQIRAIPAELAEFAWQQSAALRHEFLTFEVFLAYRRHLK